MLWLIYIISFLGALTGRIISKFTKDELREGKKYFIAGEQLILLILAGYFLYLSQISYITILALLAGILTGFFFKEIYFYFALALIMTITQSNLLLISSLIFIYGLFHGTLGKKVYYILLYSLIPIFLKDFLQYTYLYSFLAGAFLILVFKNNKYYSPISSYK